MPCAASEPEMQALAFVGWRMGRKPREFWPEQCIPPSGEYGAAVGRQGDIFGSHATDSRIGKQIAVV